MREGNRPILLIKSKLRYDTFLRTIFICKFTLFNLLDSLISSFCDMWCLLLIAKIM